MNNLKFRAYIKSIQKIVNVTEIDLNNKMATLDIPTKKVYPDISFWWKETTVPFSVIEIMQSTGLKDKNGKEIFENDIVEYLDGEYSFVGVVENSVFGIYVESKYDNYNFEDFSDENTRKSDVTIIGNIYENKELLR